jgi:hypothetical protein
MWNMKCHGILVIAGATGVVTKGLKKHLEAIPVKHLVCSLQMTAVVATVHIIRKMLKSEI